MVTHIHWPAIAVRLLLTVIAGMLLGAERSKSGHPAGLRTTLLVTLAASVAMIQVDLLIPTNGKPPDSYIVMDLMRLPLGILTGVGFIGAGAIVRKGELVLGITTAATMWYATVVGLCLGGGQLALGMVATLIGFLVLWGLRFGEDRIESNQRGTLTLTVQEAGVSFQQIIDILERAHIRVRSSSATFSALDHNRFHFEVRWSTRGAASEIPEVIPRLRQLPGLVECSWNGAGSSTDS